jgi:nucleotide-binding universal stress UspA family protein
MAYKDLLLIVDDGPDMRERLLLAAGLAERCEAHVAGLYITPASGNEAPGAAERLRDMFEDQFGQRGVSVEWRTATGFAVDVAAVQARYADLVILGQLDPTDPQAAVDRPRPEDIILSAGRPVLVVPYVGRYPSLGTCVLIGWDASREAARAVNDAMPLLAAASSVTVLSIDPVIGREEHGDIPGADIARHLGRHGVIVRVESAPSAGVGIGEVLLSRAADLSADLLVMGAYAHSRVRELVLGGATRTVLESMTLPVLIAR